MGGRGRQGCDPERRSATSGSGRACAWGRLLLKPPHHTKIPDPQSDDGCEFLPGEVVAEDAVQPRFTVLLCEAVLLPPTAKVLGHRISGREGLRRGIHDERLILPAVDHPAVFGLVSTGIAADHVSAAARKGTTSNPQYPPSRRILKRSPTSSSTPPFPQAERERTHPPQ